MSAAPKTDIIVTPPGTSPSGLPEGISSLVPPEQIDQPDHEIKMKFTHHVQINPATHEESSPIDKPPQLGLMKGVSKKEAKQGEAQSSEGQVLADRLNKEAAKQQSKAEAMEGDYLQGISGTKYHFPDDDHYRTTDGTARYAAYLKRLAVISRYTAYASDIGESFRPILPKWAVQAAYGISWAYVGGDVLYDGYQNNSRYGMKGGDLAEHMAERATFQAFASMLLPSLFVHQTVNLVARFCKLKAPSMLTWAPTVAGLACVPFLPYMFDEMVEDWTSKAFHWVRPYKEFKIVHQSTQVPEVSKPMKYKDASERLGQRKKFDDNVPAASEL